MQIGLNTDVVHQGKTLHIQTEDVIATPRYIVTHLFLAGSIIASQRCDCEEHQSEEELKGMIHKQHQSMIRAVYAGQYNRKILLHRPRAHLARNRSLARPKEARATELKSTQHHASLLTSQAAHTTPDVKENQETLHHQASSENDL